MSGRRSGAAAAATASCASPSITSPAGAAFAAVLSAPGLPPFVVWSRRPLDEAAADTVSDAARTLRAAKVETAHGETLNGQSLHSEPQTADRPSRASRSYSTAYHGKMGL